AGHSGFQCQVDVRFRFGEHSDALPSCVSEYQIDEHLEITRVQALHYRLQRVDECCQCMVGGSNAWGIHAVDLLKHVAGLDRTNCPAIRLNGEQPAAQTSGRERLIVDVVLVPAID